MSAQIRVAVFIPSLSDGGAQRQCIMLLNEWSCISSIDVIVIRTAQGVHDDALNLEKNRIYGVTVRSNYDPFVVPKVAQILKKENTDLIFSWMQASDVPSYFIRMLVPKLKWVIAERNSRHPEDWRFRLRGWLGAKADCIIANSSQGIDYWDQFNPRGRNYVIPNIVSPAYGPERNRQVSRGIDFLYVGRLEEQKNVGLLLESFAIAHKTLPESVLTIVGDGSLRESLERQAYDLGIGESTYFEGFQKDVYQYYGNARVLISLSRHEGMPNVLVEGIVQQLRIVASAIPEHLAILGDSYRYAVDHAAAPDTVAKYMMEILSDNRILDELESVSERLLAATPALIAEKYVATFNEVLGRSDDDLADKQGDRHY